MSSESGGPLVVHFTLSMHKQSAHAVSSIKYGSLSMLALSSFFRQLITDDDARATIGSV